MTIFAGGPKQLPRSSRVPDRERRKRRFQGYSQFLTAGLRTQAKLSQYRTDTRKIKLLVWILGLVFLEYSSGFRSTRVGLEKCM